MRRLRESTEINVDNMIIGNDGGNPVRSEVRCDGNVGFQEFDIPVDENTGFTTDNVDLEEKFILCSSFTNRKVFHFGLVVYWIWTLASMIGNSDIMLPIFYFLPITSFVLAFIGSTTKSYRLLYPIQLIFIIDMMIAVTEIFVLFNFRFRNDEVFNHLLRKKWPSKATQLEEINRSLYEVFLIYLILKFLYSTMMIIVTGQEITRFRVLKWFETRESTLFRRVNWVPEHPFITRIFQNREDGLYWNARFIPPPRYETLLRAPERGTPPPNYSTLGRKTIDLEVQRA